MLQIGNLSLKTPLLSAPMAGFTNYAYREILRYLGGVGLIATEMVSARSFVHAEDSGNDYPSRLWGVATEPQPLAVQIWDNDPDTLAETGRCLAKDYKIAVIDMNFGCPAPRIAQKSASGSRLLRDPQKVGDLVSRVVHLCAPTPVTAKIRLGLTADTINAIDVAQAVESAGASALTVHGRTAQQMYTGQADWQEISRVKPFLRRIPLIGNGDIKTVDEALARLNNEAVDGIMIGRGGLERPWLFHQIAQALAQTPITPDPTLSEQKALLLKHYRFVVERFGAERAVVLMRRYACCYAKSKPGARTFRAKICTAYTEDDFLQIINQYFPQDSEETTLENIEFS